MKRLMVSFCLFVFSASIVFGIDNVEMFLLPNYRELSINEINNIFINVFSLRKVTESEDSIDYQGQSDEGEIRVRIAFSQGIDMISFIIPKPDRYYRGVRYMEIENIIKKRYGEPYISIVEAILQENNNPVFLDNMLTMFEVDLIQRGIYETFWQIEADFSIRLVNNTYAYLIAFFFDNR